MPDGLVALGDSVMALNPVHGQGITVSMMGAELLRDVLAKRLAAKSSSSNPAFALRGLAKVRLLCNGFICLATCVEGTKTCPPT